MEIKDFEGLTQHLVSWIQDQAKASGLPNGVVGISGGVDSALVFALCVRALPLTVGVKMPCGSSRDSLDRANELFAAMRSKGFNFMEYEIDLQDSFRSIITQAAGQYGVEFDGSDATVARMRAQHGALRSCLRAPVLDYFGKRHDGLVYGTGNRDEDALFRYYQKRGDGAVDNNPIVCLHKSEVWALSEYLGVPASIVKAVPTADLWGPDAGQTDEDELGITYQEIEWVTQLNDSANVLAAREECGSFTVFADRYTAFTKRQLEVIEKTYHAERVSRHKASPPPGPSRDSVRSFF
jgi:NAD+ synthase